MQNKTTSSLHPMVSKHVPRSPLGGKNLVKRNRPRRDSNPQSSDPKSAALSIRPRCLHVALLQVSTKDKIIKENRPRRDSNPQSSDPKSAALSIRPRCLHVALLQVSTKDKIIKENRPRRDSNPQSSDPKSDALSIRPRGLPVTPPRSPQYTAAQ